MTAASPNLTTVIGSLCRLTAAAWAAGDVDDAQRLAQAVSVLTHGYDPTTLDLCDCEDDR